MTNPRAFRDLEILNIPIRCDGVGRAKALRYRENGTMVFSESLEWYVYSIQKAAGSRDDRRGGIYSRPQILTIIGAHRARINLTPTEAV